jgi:glucokinase
MSEQVLAIDIGGTKIAVALVDQDGRVTAEAVAPTVRSSDAEAVFAPAAEAIAEVAASYEPGSTALRVGIGSAGPINAPAGTISPVNIGAWRDFPVSQHVEDVLTTQFDFSVDVALAGDGHCFALGEHWLGAGRDVASMVGLVLSTGVGGGAVLDNRLFAGTTGNSVHLGHISVNAWGPECVCGCHGCVEWYARGPALVSAAKLRGWSGGDDARALTDDARAGDEIAISVIDYGMRALAAGIASTATQLDVTTFVLGGGVSKAGEVIFGPLRQHLRDFATLDFVADLEVRPAILENAGLLGAAALAFSLPETASDGAGVERR